MNKNCKKGNYVCIYDDALYYYYFFIHVHSLLRYYVFRTCVYDFRFTEFLTHNKLINVVQIKNPIKFNMDDEIKMYLNAPVTSLQFKSLKWKAKKKAKLKFDWLIDSFNYKLINCEIVRTVFQCDVNLSNAIGILIISRFTCFATLNH